MKTYTLQEGAAAIRHTIAFCLKKVDDNIIEKAEHGLKVLEYISNYQDIVKMAIRLEKEYPDVAKIFKAFPGASIVDIRDKPSENKDAQKNK